MLPSDRARWPAEAIEWWEERAAIIEYDAHAPRDVADLLAELLCRRALDAPPTASPR